MYPQNSQCVFTTNTAPSVFASNNAIFFGCQSRRLFYNIASNIIIYDKYHIVNRVGCFLFSNCLNSQLKYTLLCVVLHSISYVIRGLLHFFCFRSYRLQKYNYEVLHSIRYVIRGLFRFRSHCLQKYNYEFWLAFSITYEYIMKAPLMGISVS